MCSGQRSCRVIGEARASGPAQQGVVTRHGAHREDFVCLSKVISRHPPTRTHRKTVGETWLPYKDVESCGVVKD